MEARANSGPSITWNVFFEMNHREPPHLPAGMRRAVYGLSLALLQVMASADATALPQTRPLGSGPERLHVGSPPYLTAVGPCALRFQTPAPPPAIREIIPITAMPAAASEDTATVASNEAAHPGTEHAPPGPSVATESAASAPSTGVPAKSPQPILRDNITPTVRAEDFLPYFQIPGSAQNPSDVTLLVPAAPSAPAPAAIPPSSATYRQTP